jgi:hypothetical protein
VQVEAGQELVGEVDFVVGGRGVGEGEDERALRLGGGLFAGDAVLLGFLAGGRVGVGCEVHAGLGPPQVSEDAVVASFPVEVLGDA